MATNRRPGGGGRPSLPPELDAIDSAWGGERIPTSSAPPPLAPALPPVHLEELARQAEEGLARQGEELARSLGDHANEHGARLAFGSESPTKPRDVAQRAAPQQPTEPSLQRPAILPEPPTALKAPDAARGRDARTVPNRPNQGINAAAQVDRNRATDPAPVRPSSNSQLGAQAGPGRHPTLSKLEADRMTPVDLTAPGQGSSLLGGSSGAPSGSGLAGTLASLRGGGSFKRTIASLGGLAPSTPPDNLRPMQDQYPGGSSDDAHDRPTVDAGTPLPGASWSGSSTGRLPGAPQAADQGAVQGSALRDVVPPVTNRGGRHDGPLLLQREPAATEIRHSEAPTAPPPDQLDIERLRLASIPRASSVEQVERVAQSEGGSLPPQPALSSRGRRMSPPDGQRATDAQRPSGRLGGAPKAAVERPSSPADEMRDRFSMGDFSGALERAEAVLAASPGDAEARTMAARCSDVLFEMYSSRIGDFSRGVRVIMSPEKLRWLSLDHRAGFLLSLVDGISSIDELLDVSGMKRLDAVRQIANLLEQKVIELL